MNGLDRMTARALAEAGYLPLRAYLDEVGQQQHPGPPLVPDAPDDPHDPLLPEALPAQPMRVI